MNAPVTLKPFAMPAGMDPRTWRQEVGKRINELLDQSMALITALDVMESDCDLEDGADAEPSLGCLDDLELDNSDDEDDGTAEPMHGAIEGHPTSRDTNPYTGVAMPRSGELTVQLLGSNSQAHWGGDRATAPSHDECEAENEHGGDVDEPHDEDVDREPSLGWTTGIDQRFTMKVDDTAWIEDGEQDGGDMREGDDEREADCAEYDGPGLMTGGNEDGR
ncbi:hypothetical protein ACFSOZ_06875 [Mesorhizobium newzealandense]|uniref:Uncharacterized protein n=1 Tax=Mesorhizobium newzealandense TaxID=1300302 RepID=A0ABW4U856_9HYPH